MNESEAKSKTTACFALVLNWYEYEEKGSIKTNSKITNLLNIFIILNLQCTN
ncbi:MAG: hypothetical protein DMENIID0003_05660 [Wolbachia endosymbiont of Sergentomyia squamirostris]|uniref:Uncharacterized protein n=1 Tax=Wolbachia endosymbiont of Sergentomyia squamirostris TaxID=3113640 RepID=A0AAT9GCJ5_9RICK